MPRKGQRQPEAARGPNGTIARGTRYGLRKRDQLQAERDRLVQAIYWRSPAEIRALRESGMLDESTDFYADVAAAEIERLRRAVEGDSGSNGGPPPRPLSAQREARLARAQRLLTLGLTFQARALTAGDRESAATAGQLIAKADALLVDTLGMETEAQVPSLAQYIEARRREAKDAPQGAHYAANGGSPAPQAEGAEIVTHEGEK